MKRGDAIQACAAFDLSLAAPLNQAEYDNLKTLVKEHELYEWIDGYRSHSDKKEWQVTGIKIPYEITWSEGEPNNARNAENCFGEKINYKSPLAIQTFIFSSQKFERSCRDERRLMHRKTRIHL